MLRRAVGADTPTAAGMTKPQSVSLQSSLPACLSGLLGGLLSICSFSLEKAAIPGTNL